MKTMILVLASFVSLSAYAGDRAENMARKTAFVFAGEVFSELAQDNVDYSVQLRDQSRQHFAFDAVARISDERCYLEVFVDKNTGEAFKVNEVSCQ